MKAKGTILTQPKTEEPFQVQWAVTGCFLPWEWLPILVQDEAQPGLNTRTLL